MQLIQCPSRWHRALPMLVRQVTSDHHRSRSGRTGGSNRAFTVHHRRLHRRSSPRIAQRSVTAAHHPAARRRSRRCKPVAWRIVSADLSVLQPECIQESGIVVFAGPIRASAKRPYGTFGADTAAHRRAASRAHYSCYFSSARCCRLTMSVHTCASLSPLAHHRNMPYHNRGPKS